MDLVNLDYERRLHKTGFNFVGGADEVGRGSFAGPLIAACVVFGKRITLPKDVVVRDSKKMTAMQRAKANVWIKENAISWGVGEVSVSFINKKGITKSTYSGFRRSVKKVNESMGVSIDYLLVDAFFIPRIRHLPVVRQNAVKRADNHIFSVAAASIVAKVYRDSLMERLGKKEKYLPYKWHKNKGYGTRQHRDAILRYGKTLHHRNKFIETFMTKETRSY